MSLFFQLPKNLISELRQPFGKVVKGEKKLKKVLKEKKYPMLICIGDFSNLCLKNIGILPDIAIFDGKIERKSTGKNLSKIIQSPVLLRAKNPTGTIAKESWDKVKLAFCYNLPVKIFIKGEEDLLFLPVSFFAPLGSIIVYGLWNKGGVVVKVNRKLKKKVENYLKIGYKGKEDFSKEKEIIAAGTFDNLHLGHKFFLLTALEKGKKCLICLTSDEYLKNWKSKKEKISSFKKRKNAVEKFLKNFGFHFELFKIDDPFGIALEKGNAILVSKDTEKRAKEINKKRKEIGLKPLKIIKVKTILAEDGKEISSSRIRKGEIDENGKTL